MVTPRVVAPVAILALLVPTGVTAVEDQSGAAGEEVRLSDLARDTLAGVVPQSPDDFAADDTGLQYADPTEALSLIEPPSPAQDGSVGLSYPLSVPPGHGITPELAATYSSEGGNGWMGVGWDLAVGEISVDTSFGAPHFSKDEESESYLLDGELLTPNANGSAWEPREVGDRSDFSRQVETDYDEIIRHQEGTGWPATYFWEVRGKDGSVRWYGGHPDSGGPAATTGPSFDEDAVVRDDAGHIVTWLLSAERDIGVNLIRYDYETVEYGFSGGWTVADCDAETELCGRHTYLDTIRYTDATSAVTDFNGAPYQIDLIRESELRPDEDVRGDPVVDARLGYVDVVVDRLARVEVRYGPPPTSGTTRAYKEIAARYDFRYDTTADTSDTPAATPFGKTLLRSIDQGVDDVHTHTISWYDDLGWGKSVTGFEAPVDWGTGSDVPARSYLDQTADVSVLGGAESDAGSGSIYVGFNPITPSKTGSFGAGIEFSGGTSEAIVEWIDLNGDNLPDKVFTSADGISFRLNDTGPDGSREWPKKATSQLPGLSRDEDFGFQVSGEAYPVVAIGVGTGFALSWTNSYFADVNADGLVDFVHEGQVLFNRLVDGIPTFSAQSTGTPVPLDPAPLPTPSSAELAELSDQVALQSPPLDTVRRFLVPYTGTVSIEAPVTLADGATADGVRVAIQHNDTELDSAELSPGGSTSAFGSARTVGVTAGDRIYFRVGAVDDGPDAVAWNPVITYQSPDWPELDANGLSQHAFDASADFTLAGRPDDFVGLPAAGTVQIQGSVTTTAELTDDVTVVALRRSPDGTLTRTELDSLPAGSAATTLPVLGTVQAQLTTRTVPVEGGPDQEVTENDLLSVYLEADSPIDLGDLAFEATLTYLDAQDVTGASIPLVYEDGSPFFEQQVRPHVELYPYSDATSGSRTTSGLSGSPKVRFAVQVPDDDALPAEVEAVVTVKSSAGLVAKKTVTLQHNTFGIYRSDKVNLGELSGPDEQWVDVMVRDPLVTRNGAWLSSFVEVKDNGDEKNINRVTLRWSGLQGIFPQPYRGWGVAGYTAGDGLGDAKIREDAFELDDDRGSDTPVRKPKRSDVSMDKANTEPAYAFLPALPPGTEQEPVDTPRWKGPQPHSYVDADTTSASRLALDSVHFDVAGESGSGRRAPTRLSRTGPGVTASFGLAMLGVSAGLSPSWGLSDFEDLNGDGYPDVVATGSVVYTDQIGGYLDSRTVKRTDYTNQDLTVAVSGGLDSGMVDIAANPKGNTNSVSGDSSNKSQGNSDSGPSYSIGVSGNGGYSWSSPNASVGDPPGDKDYSSQVNTLVSDFGVEEGAEIQRALADVNGDGLPDSVYTTAEGTFAFYNLGYGFTPKAAKLSSGGFESKESATGGLGLGFSLPYGEFGGGVNFLWNYDWSTYAWNDLNGDGILDRLRRASDSSIKVAFGTGSGLLPEMSYGDFATVPVDDTISGGQHIAFDRASGMGGGASATGYIGPLCIGACYLVIGGGGGYNNSISSSNTTVEDVDGDGAADILLSLDDDTLTASLSRQGRTNLLEGVTNPLGGSFTVDYERTGNTTAHPDSLMVMSRLDVRDGRSTAQEVAGMPTTGHYASAYTYDGLDYDRAHRTSLGFSRVQTLELDTTDGDTPLRRTEQRYLNDNVFVSGLLTEVRMSEPDPSAADGWAPFRGASVTWGLRTVRAVDDVPADFDAGQEVALVAADALGADAHTVASRGWSIAPLPEAQEEYWFDVDDAGTPVHTFSTRTELTYDGRGNVLVERDLGAPDDDLDDLTTTIRYTDCTEDGVTALGCLDLATPRQPFWSPGSCVNWASYPVEVTVTGVDPDDGSATVLRARRAPLAMCDNGAPTQLEELVSPGTWAMTTMTVNAFGDYELVLAPADEQGIRYTVRYDYDADRHTDIAQVREFDVAAADAAAVLSDGPSAANAAVGTASSATFDPLSGRVASRTDANGVTRGYRYDEHGRIVARLAPTTGTPTDDLITYEYHANAADYGYAIARHTDAFDGNATPAADDTGGQDATETIDTVTFVDGMGRVRLTKRDARLSVAGAAPTSTRQVSDAVAFDPLARPTVEFGPTADDGPAASFGAAATSGTRTVSEWTIYDSLGSLTEPGDRVTSFDYPWDTAKDPLTGATSPLLAWTVATDPEGRVVSIGQDVRDVTRFHVDQAAPRTDADGQPVPAPDDLVTAYRVNGLGELTSVVDSAGQVSTYGYDLAGRPTRVSTPDGGTVRTTYDLAGHRRTTVTPEMAATGLESAYSYTFNRLTAIDHPGSVDDVTYTYGLDNADGRMTAGRVAAQTDRTRLVQNSYDHNGNLVVQDAVMKRHNWTPGLSEEEQEKFRYRTTWSYDDLGRVAQVGFPDDKSVQFLPDSVVVGSLSTPEEVTALMETEHLPGGSATYDYDSGGLLRSITGSEEGIRIVEEDLAPDADGVVTTVSVPRRTTHGYAYLDDRVYDPRLLQVRDDLGNGTVTEASFDADTQWLSTLRTTGLDGVLLQNLSYGYDVVGRPLGYVNDLPRANRAINGGAATQDYVYDGFGRIVGASGTFDIKKGEQQRYSYGVEFTAAAPWSIVAKEQQDALHTTKGKKTSSSVEDGTTYSFVREVGTSSGPLQAAADTVTTADGETARYDATYSRNGELTSFLEDPDAGPSPTNDWDRDYTWTLTGELTSVARGAELKTYAYDDTGTLRIKDGSLLTRDGEVVAEHGGGPETLFLNPWVTVRAQKIYKQVSDGDRTLMNQMDSGGGEETKRLFAHVDLTGSTAIVSDVEGRGFQRHEYFPSGEIWISDQKEEIRTPFQFGGGYYEDSVDMILFGRRWYDAEREVMLSPDPLLAESPRSLIDQPELGAAYTFAGAAPTVNVDPTGRAFFSAHQRLQVRKDGQAAFDAAVAQLMQDGSTAEAQIMMTKRTEKAERQNRAESLDANALIQINPFDGTVSIGAPYGPRKEWGGTSAADGSGSPASSAAGADGTPDDGSSGVTQGSTAPSTGPADGQQAGGQDVGDGADGGSAPDTGASAPVQPATPLPSTSGRSDD